MKTPLRLIALCAFTLYSGIATISAADQNTETVRQGEATWEIHYGTKLADGSLRSVEGRLLGSEVSFRAKKCTVFGDSLLLENFFIVSKGNTDVVATEEAAQAFLSLEDARFRVAHGRAQTRIRSER